MSSPDGAAPDEALDHSDPLDRPPLLHRVLAVADRVCFLAAGAAAVLLSYLLLRQGSRTGLSGWWVDVLLWLVLAYVGLPRLHQILTALYLPATFLGRTRTSDGLLGDPVNVAVLGTEDRLRHALESAGWTTADPIRPRSVGRMITSVLLRRSYPRAPVSPLLLFGRTQDFAYQLQVAGTPTRRHHIRFWRCPDGWLLPGALEADWLAAATYDRSVGFSLFTLQLTHRINRSVDAERDLVVGTLRSAVPAAEVRLLRRFSAGLSARNGGGDPYATDGDLPIVDLQPDRSADERHHDRAVAPPGQPRSGSVAIGAAVALLTVRAVLDVIAAAAPGVGPVPLPAFAALTSTPDSAVLLVDAAVRSVAAVLLVLRSAVGRAIALAAAVLSIATSTTVHFVTGQESLFSTDLLPLAADILLLVALTVEDARRWTSAGAPPSAARPTQP